MQDRVSSSEKKIVIFSLISCEFCWTRSGLDAVGLKQCELIDIMRLSLPRELE